MSDTDLAYLPATEIRSMIAEKKVSSVEMTKLYLDRIDSLDSQFNSYLTVTSDLALEMAAEADRAVARGDDLGPLHGLPISIKDLEMTEGIRTTSGSLIFADRIAAYDSVVVERVKKAGAVISRQDEYARIRTARSHGEPSWRPLPQPLEHGADDRRFERRRGRVSRRGSLRSGNRQRRRRIDTHPRGVLRHLRHQADPGQDILLPRTGCRSRLESLQSAGPYDAHRCRLSPSAPGPCRT